jgi:hypothetical protein
MRPKRHPVWTDQEPAAPEAAGFRGVVYGLGPSLVLWLAIGALLWWVLP